MPKGAYRRHLSRDLSDWEVIEAIQRWDGTQGGAMQLEAYYGVSYRTLLRAFERARAAWEEMRADG